MAPKSLPHKITVPGLNALFGGGPKAEDKAAPSMERHEEEPRQAGKGDAPPHAEPAKDPAPVSATPAPPAPLQVLPPAEPAPAADSSKGKRRASKSVRVTQPETKGNPKGRHTLVIGEDVLEDLSLLAWAENMSVSALAREAFDAYLAKRKDLLQQARKLRESFDQPRAAV